MYDFDLDREIYVEREDVREKDDKKFWGIAPNKMVRLRYGPFLRIKTVTKDKVTAEIVDLKDIPDYKKIKGILHWVSKP